MLEYQLWNFKIFLLVSADFFFYHYYVFKFENIFGVLKYMFLIWSKRNFYYCLLISLTVE